MVGWRFEDQVGWEEERRIVTFDFEKMDEIRGAWVWYPSKVSSSVMIGDMVSESDGRRRTSSALAQDTPIR